jgi:prepilin-type N-terminal cleavage/methylation domain-containing protein
MKNKKLFKKLNNGLKKILNSQSSILNSHKGQSLVEVIIAIAVGAILIGGATAIIVPVLRSNLETRNVGIATSLAQEYLENIQALAESDWRIIYNPPAAKGINSQFYLAPSSTSFMLVSGATSSMIETKVFTRYFSIENVNRNLCGVSDITTDATTTCSAGPGSAGVGDDPSTQKITIAVSWPTSSITRVEYLTHNINKVFVQTDWSGGPGQEGPITSPNDKFASSTNIDYATSTGSIIIQGF